MRGRRCEPGSHRGAAQAPGRSCFPLGLRPRVGAGLALASGQTPSQWLSGSPPGALLPRNPLCLCAPRALWTKLVYLGFLFLNLTSTGVPASVFPPRPPPLRETKAEKSGLVPGAEDVVSAVGGDPGPTMHPRLSPAGHLHSTP